MLNIASLIVLPFRPSLDKDVVLTAWKSCSITPILKAGDPYNVFNYRPIPINPRLAKLLELLVYNSKLK